MINKDFYLTIGSIIFANLITLFGVIFFDWNILQIMLVYWCESGIIGFYNILKIITSKVGLFKRIVSVLFFPVYYGTFLLIVLILTIGMLDYGIKITSFNQLFSIASSTLFPATIIPISIFIISHGISFLKNYIGKEEYKKYTSNKDLSSLFYSPYSRIGIMISFLMIGGAIMEKIGQPKIGIVSLILAKIVIDIDAHLKSHGEPGLFFNIHSNKINQASNFNAYRIFSHKLLNKNAYISQEIKTIYNPINHDNHK